MADLEGSDEEEEAEVKEEEEEMDSEDIKPSKLELEQVQPKKQTLAEIAVLHNSDRLLKIMKRIDKWQGRVRKKVEQLGPIENDPEYQLIVEANNLAAEIDQEQIEIHKFGKDVYTKRFPELETLVVMPLEYLNTAKELGNQLENVKNNENLLEYLTQATVMVVSVTASTTQGKDLTKEELDTVANACDIAMELHESKVKIFEYVESRMAFIAPNVSAILGAPIAAKLMGAAGGLTKLSKMPSNNICLLGQSKERRSGFSTATQLPHTGMIYYSALVQDAPADLRRKVARVVGAKVTLAARVDSFHQATDGNVGVEYREEILKKIDKFREPPSQKAVRTLPVPLDAPKKKRGGRRVRQMKERYAVTELRKQANRMTFGELEEDLYQNDLGYTRGNIGKGGIGGAVRAAQVDERTKVRISQTLKKNMQKQQAVWGGATSIKGSDAKTRRIVSGMASSVAFTPVQGLEIMNPAAAEAKVNAANQKYFSATSGFLSVKPKTT